MRFIVLLVLFLCSFFSVSATSWTFVGHDSNGRSIYIDSSSIKVDDFQHRIDENKPIIISAIIKSDKPGTDHYIEGQIRFYSTGWIEADKQYIYHKGTGKIIDSFTLPDDKNPSKIVPGTVDEQLYNNLFAQYYERQKKSNTSNSSARKDESHKLNHESKQNVQRTVPTTTTSGTQGVGESESDGLTLGVLAVYVGWMIFLEIIFRLILKKVKTITFNKRLLFYLVTFIFMGMFDTVNPSYKGSDAHYIAETLGYIVGSSIVPLILTTIIVWGYNKVRNETVEGE